MECPRCGLFNPDSAMRCDCGYDFLDSTKKESYLTSKDNINYLAERNSRLYAVLIDAAVIFVIFIPIVIAFTYTNTFQNPPTVIQKFILSFIAFGILLLLNAYLLFKKGQTIGKAFLKIKIVRSDLSQASGWRIIFLRYLPLYIINPIPFFGPLFSLADVLFIFNSSRKCVHDEIADTIVIKSNK